MIKNKYNFNKNILKNKSPFTYLYNILKINRFII